MNKLDNWNLVCKLFGHKFVVKVATDPIPDTFHPFAGAPAYFVSLRNMPFCSRCGTANSHYNPNLKYESKCKS